MLNLLNLFKKDRLWDFDGGIHPPEMKTQSNGTPLRHLPLPAQFVLPLKQHIGHEGEIGVRPGDQVLRGQPLTFGTGRMLPVHAPTSGTVSKIAPHMTAHPSALAEMCLFILPDGEDRWCEKRPLEDYRSVERSELVARVHQAGVAGLGGAGFPTASKLKGGLHGVNTLIINAAECEPYITADDRLMQDHAAEVLEGSRILAWILQAERVLIGIEDNKPEAIAALKKALGSATDLHIRVIPTKYPSGGAKQLTKILTGKEVPHGGRSTDIGVLMQNVGTAFAVKRAIIDGEPLTERVVTLTGESVAQPGNVWARLGTPISHLLQHAGFIPGAEQMVVMGGPLMGFTLPTLDVPVVKITNCILAPAASEMGQNEAEQGCIRCSACADACPAALLPQQLYWYSRGGDHDKARAHNIADCIECGACAYVCPSNIPLVQYYRQEKAEIQAIDLEAERAALAKNRFEARQQRLEREKAARSAKHQQAKRSVASSDAGAIAAARERVAARQAEGVPPENHADNSLQAAVQAQHEAEVRVHQADLQAANEPVTRQTLDPRKAAVEAAIARTKAKKAAQAAEVSATEAPQQPAPEDEPRKAAVAAAVARTKAKKAAQAAEASATEAPQQSAPEDDPRKAAVAAAVARAKAKKAAKAAEASATEAPQQPAPEDDPRKAAVAAAVARAKAKKAAKAAEASATEAPQQPAPEDDPRKAAVAAAVARAKAKKAAQAAEASATEAPQQSAPEDDPHKAAVAAAVARAKAKKAARAAEASATEAPQQSAPEHDPRKAAVAAAVARAKAKKAAQAAEASATEAPLQPAPEDDPRKAAIAAAIARAKARKTQQPSMQED